MLPYVCYDIQQWALDFHGSCKKFLPELIETLQINFDNYCESPRSIVEDQLLIDNTQILGSEAHKSSEP